MVLIMSVMLGMYQYFTAKRSSDVTLNKDERKFEVELNCLKQFHDYGTAQNEALLTEQEITPIPYTCAGSKDIKVFKYCLNVVNIETPCNMNANKHCVSSTIIKKDLKKNNSLKSLMFKKGIYEVVEQKIPRDGTTISNQTPKATGDDTAMGLVSCIPASRIEEQQKMATKNCQEEGEGLFAVLINGKYECSDAPDLTNCTAHEVFFEKDANISNQKNCTIAIGGGNCCSIPSTNICGTDITNVNAVWNTDTRFFKCENKNNACPQSLSMDIKDENDSSRGNTSSISKPYIPQYDSINQRWNCKANSEALISQCRSAATAKDYAFVSVSNLTEIINSNTATASKRPVCNVASSKSANAIEACSACGTANLVNGKWECTYASNWTQLKSKGPDYIDALRGNIVTGANTKGVTACFRGCDKYIEQIKAGMPNGLDWGLKWNPSSKLWECYECKQTYINEFCKSTSTETGEEESCSDTNYETVEQCPGYKNYRLQNNINGRCILNCCNSLYQKRGTDSKCYTKWCRGNLSSINAVIGKPSEKTCPESHSRLVFNELKDCVYCIRPPPDRIN